MQKTRKLLIVGVILSLILMCLFPTLGMAETTEHFSDEGSGNSSFTNSGFTFNLTGGRFVIANATDYGWTGTAKDDYYMDNYGNYPAAAGVLGSITSAASTFKVTDLYLFPGVTGDMVSNDGTVIIRGKLSGVTKFTHTVASGSINTNGAVNNTYTYVDLSSYNSFAIDQLEFEVTGSLRYLAIDAFKHTSISPNSAPTDISLTASSVNENVAGNTTVGTLSTTDPDAGNTFTYTLVAGTGDTDNASFNISGNSLRITNSPDYETKNSYSVRVRSTDQGGLYYEEAFTITVNNVVPAVTSVSVPANATYIAGQNLDFTVNFDENVTVNTGGGTPYIPITLATGGTVNASYISGTGTSALVFRYTVQSGNLDTDGVAVGASITANGGTLRDGASTDANLTLNNIGNTSAVLVDAVAPTVSSVSVPANATYIAGQNLDFTVNFDENVTVNTGGGTPYIPITLATGGTVNASYLSGSGTAAIVFRYTVQSGNLDADGVAVGASITSNGGTLRDAATNNANLTLNNIGNTTAVLVDAVAPTVTSVSVPADATYKALQNLDFTVNFSENVTVNTGGGTPYIPITLATGGTVNASYISGTGTSALVFRYTVQSGNLDADGVAVGASITANGGTLRDAASNNANLTLNNIGNTTAVLVDAVAPTVNITSAASNPTNASSFSATFTFSENVSGFAVGDITVGNGSAGNFATTNPSTYTADITPTGQGAVTIDVAGGVASDSAGNNNTAAVQLSRTFDSVAPTVDDANASTVYNAVTHTLIVKITESGGIATGIGSSAVDISKFTVKKGVESETLSIGQSSITITDPSTLTITIGGTDLTAVQAFSGGEGINAVDVAAGGITDKAGNSNINDNGNTVATDLAPTLQSAVRTDNTHINVTLSEGCTNITKANNGGFSVYQTGTPGITYAVSAIAQGADNSHVVLTVANMSISAAEGVTVVYTAGGNGTIQDLTGNSLATDVTGVNASAWDTSSPTISSASLSLNNTYLDITFSEGVYGANDGITALTAAKLALTFTQNSGSATNATISSVKQNNNAVEGSASALAGGETVVRVFLNITGTPSGTETIEIKPANATSVNDKGGNAAQITQTTGVKTLNDKAAPTVTNLSPADNAVNFNSSSNLVITFSENVVVGTGNIYIRKTSDFSTVETIDVTGGLVTGSGTSTITINPGSDLQVSTGYFVMIAPTAFADVAGNSFAGITDNITWNFTTAALPSEINIKQVVDNISDGGSYGFGDKLVNSNNDITFTVENTGTGSLSITTPLSLGGANADQFSIQAQPVSPVAASGTTTFAVRFTPTSAGAKTATLAIANNDSDENPYNITFTGTGIAPLMSIEGNSAAIANGDNSPSASDHTDFGTTAVTGGTVQRTFTIKNTGSAALNLTGTPKVDVTGANAAEFTVSSQPTSPIAATNGTSTFTVTFDPAGPGTRTATISIANDTAGTNPYTFDISGSGLCGIIVTPTSGLTTTESGGTATFTVVLDCAPTADVTVNLASSNTSEGTVSPSSLTFTAANWNVPQTVTVTGVDDSTFDGSKSYQITT